MQIAANGIKRHSGASTTPHVVQVVRVLAVSVASLVVGLTAAWALTAAWCAARDSVIAPGPASSAEVLTLAAATVAIAIAGWLLLGTALEMLGHVPGRIGRAAQAGAGRLSPALARRVAAFVIGVGVGVAGGPTQAVASPRDDITASSVAEPGFVATRDTPGMAVADPGFAPTAPDPGFSSAPPDPAFTPDTPDTTDTTASPAAPSPGFTPRAPRVRPQPDPGLLGSRLGAATDDEVVVHRGDTLWALVASHLGPDASDAEIAQAWPRWFAFNRDLIGDDPHLLLPGQILRVPDAQQTASATR